uniref:Uncharacterized protein n=1 Tax=Solanum tuberosum TaxID=4113 RepID=M1B7P3_SOLTU
MYFDSSILLTLLDQKYVIQTHCPELNSGDKPPVVPFTIQGDSIAVVHVGNGGFCHMRKLDPDGRQDDFITSSLLFGDKYSSTVTSVVKGDRLVANGKRRGEARRGDPSSPFSFVARRSSKGDAMTTKGKRQEARKARKASPFVFS